MWPKSPLHFPLHEAPSYYSYYCTPSHPSPPSISPPPQALHKEFCTDIAMLLPKCELWGPTSPYTVKLELVYRSYYAFHMKVCGGNSMGGSGPDGRPSLSSTSSCLGCNILTWYFFLALITSH